MIYNLKQLEQISGNLVVDKEIENRISPLSPEKYQALKQSIFEKGLEVPIDVVAEGKSDGSGDFIGIVADGYHRCRAMKELGLTIKPENIRVVDIGRSEAAEYTYRVNSERRQLNYYQDTLGALKTYGNTLTQKEIAKKIGINEKTVNKVLFIQKQTVVCDSQTDKEKDAIAKILSNLESGETSVTKAHEQLKTASEVMDRIYLIKDKKFQKKMEVEFETEKYTDKAATKKLQEKIRLYEAEISGKAFEATPYDKDVLPVVSKIIKLEGKYTGVNTVSFAGNQSAIDNAMGSVRRFLMNNINENITDVLEDVRSLLIEELEQKREKDLAVIMKKFVDVIKIADKRYFLSVMEFPRNPKGVD